MSHYNNNLEQEFQLYSALLIVEAKLKELDKTMPLDITIAGKKLAPFTNSINKLVDIAKNNQAFEVADGLLDLALQVVGVKEEILKVKEEIFETRKENADLKKQLKSFQQ